MGIDGEEISFEGVIVGKSFEPARGDDNEDEE